ncbi:formylglycine-generating enzyme family protein [Pirellulales bacterium]|nr:formylglycine-generating enzyme family protein [Pirellulales bacterium]
MPRLPFTVLLALLVCVASSLGISKEGDSQPADSPTSVVGLQAEKPADGPFVETPQGFMVPYVLAIPGSDVEFEMVPVPGGDFLLGSPEGEAGRNADEGPQVPIYVSPFWIGKYEVTWAEYKEFMRLYSQFKQLEQLRGQFAERDGESPELPDALRQATHLAEHLNKKPSFVDGITCPTPLYEPDATFESGEDPRQPAVTMTPYSAKQYTKWLSKISGHSYRLPSESEWEYAARAGTDTAFGFGDDPAQLADHAWFAENSDDRSQNVGEKAPNAWGLYDMHGNVAELVLDQYSADAYEQLQVNQPVAAADAVFWPTDPYERVVRGGSWLDEPELLRSAARMVTDDVEWKMSDPNLPLSPWWYTELYPAGGVGFRLVRPLAPMSDEMAKRVWEIDAEPIQFDVDARLDEGRGALEITPPELPTVLEELKRRDVQKLLE